MDENQEALLKKAQDLAGKIPETEAPAEVPAEAQEPTTPEAPAEVKRCIRCGLPHDQEELVVNEEDKKEYMRRVLANEVYSKTYPLFDGALSITMENLLNKDSMHVERILNSLPDINPIVARAQILRIKGVMYIRQAGKSKMKLPEVNEDTEAQELLDLWEERTKDMNEDMVVLVVQTLVQHMAYMNRLAESAFDRNFWRGAGFV